MEAADEPGGSKPKDSSGWDRDGESKPEHAPVDRYVVQVREALWNQPHQEFPGEEENRKAGDPAKQEKQQALGKELADEPHSLRSQSLPNRNLTTSQTGAGKQEIGDVDAADQHDQTYRADQQN